MSEATNKLNVACVVETDPEVAAVEAEIAAADAELSALEESIASSTKLERKKIELEQKRRKIADAKLIEKLTLDRGLKGKKWDVLDTSSGLVAISRPEGKLAMFYKRWCDEGQSTKLEELQKLVKPLLLHPLAPEYEKWCDIEPATPMPCANLVNALAGARVKDIEGK